MNILYLHGLGSNGNSSTAEHLRKYLPEDLILSPTIPINPLEAVGFIRDYFNNHKVDIVIGTSLGGFYAQLIASVPTILINPGLDADNDVQIVCKDGVIREFATGNTYPLDYKFIEDIKHIKNIINDFIIDEESMYNTYGVFSTDDEFFSHKEDFEVIYNKSHSHTIKGTHRMTEENILNDIIPLIKEIM